MNAKLKALAEQAGYFVEFEQKQTGEVGLVVTDTPGTHGDPELLAKLIIESCVDMAKQKAAAIKTKSEMYSADLGEMATGLSLAWQIEVFADQLRQEFDHV